MKSFALIAFIISNLLFVSLVSAASAIDEGIQTHAIQSHEHAGTHDLSGHKHPLNDFDDSKCNHLCHFSLHLMGFISQYSELPVVNLAIALPVANESFPSLILDPPFQPPQA